MTTVVTGASGFLGGNLVRALLAEGRKVRVLIHKNTRSLEGLDVERCTGDLRDPDSLKKAFRGTSVVYHAAAKIAVTRFGRKSIFETNALGTANVARACLDSGVSRLVAFSSCHALSEHPLDRPVTEQNGLCRSDERPLPYSSSKAAAECEILSAVEKGLDAVILNPTALVGPHDYEPSQIGEAVLDLARGRYPAMVEGAYDFVDVRDVAATALRAERIGRRGERYLVSGRRLTLNELAEEVAVASGTPPPSWTCPMWLARGAAPFSTVWGTLTGRRPKFTGASLQVLRGNSRFDGSKARAELDHRPRPIRATLEDTVAWYRETKRFA